MWLRLYNKTRGPGANIVLASMLKGDLRSQGRGGHQMEEDLEREHKQRVPMPVVDVGSGFGRLSAFIRMHTAVRRVRGVEINECRHNAAVAMLQASRSSIVTPHFVHANRTAEHYLRGLQYVNGDVRAVGLSAAMTHLYFNGICGR